MATNALLSFAKTLSRFCRSNHAETKARVVQMHGAISCKEIFSHELPHGDQFQDGFSVHGFFLERNHLEYTEQSATAQVFNVARQFRFLTRNLIQLGTES